MILIGSKPVIPETGIAYILDCGHIDFHMPGMKTNIPVIGWHRGCSLCKDLQVITATWSTWRYEE